MIELEDISKWIAQSTAFSLGFTLQTHHFSSKAPDRCALVTNEIGGKPSTEFRPRFDYHISVYTRAKKYEDAQTDSNALYEFLHDSNHNQVTLPVDGVPEFVIVNCEANNTPQIWKKDEKGRWLYRTTYRITIMTIGG